MEKEQENLIEEKSSTSQLLDNILDVVKVKHALIIAVALFLIYNLFSLRINSLDATYSTLSSDSFHYQDQRFNHTSFYNNTIKDEPLEDLIIYRKHKKEEIAVQPKTKKPIIKKVVPKKQIVAEKKVEHLNKVKENNNFFKQDKLTETNLKQAVSEKKAIEKKIKVEEKLIVKEDIEKKTIEPTEVSIRKKGNKYFSNPFKRNKAEEVKTNENNQEVLTFNDNTATNEFVETKDSKKLKNWSFTFQNAKNLFKQYQYKQNNNSKNTLLKTKLKNKEFFQTEVLVEKMEDIKFFDGIRFEE